MKRTLLSIIASLGIFTVAVAQVEAYIDGGSTNYINGVYNVAPSSGIVAPVVSFKNVGGVTQNWTVKRERINEIAEWHDYLCWGHENDMFGGTCYTAGNMSTNPWTTPNSFDVANNEHGKLTVDVAPDYGYPGTVTYRYTVIADGTTELGYVDVVVSVSSNELAETEPYEVSIAPNPASNFVQITATGNNNSSYTVVDVLGNVIKKEAIENGIENIDVRKFKNGIYFFTIETNGEKSVTRKVIVRH